MTAAELFNKILSEIPDAAPGKMFGANAIKMLNGKAGAFFKNDTIFVKLTAETLDEAQKNVQAKPFSPKEGYVMNGWYEIPFTKSESWKKYAEISCADVAKLEANPKKPKK